jgi:ParB family chromosome partitioning protein
LLSVGHAKALLGLSGPEAIRSSAEKIIRDGLSVRQAEQMVAEINNPAATKPAAPASAKPAQSADIHVLDLQDKLQERLGTKVQLKYKGGKGAVEIRFFNDDDLERILQILGVSAD